MVTLTYGATTLTLPSPMLNDTEFISLQPQFYWTMSYQPRTYITTVDSSKFVLTIPLLTTDTVDAINDFIKLVDNDTCTYVDVLNTSHTVLILTIATEENYSNREFTQVVLELEEVT